MTAALTETPYTTGSHYVSLAGGGNGGKEEVYFYFTTTLPRTSTPVRVTVSADRYVTASWGGETGSWTDWRLYASEVREDDGSNYGPAVNITDARRKYLNETVVATARAWLGGADYLASREKAYAHALLREARDLKGYSDPPSRRLRDELAKYADEVSAETLAKLTAVADAYDAYSAALKAVDA